MGLNGLKYTLRSAIQLPTLSFIVCVLFPSVDAAFLATTSVDAAFLTTTSYSSQRVGRELGLERKKLLFTRSKALSSTENDQLDWSFPQDEQSNDFGDDQMGNKHIPSTGISVSDEMEAAQKERFVTEVVPIKDLPGVAQLVTSSVMQGSFDPIRYLVALTPPPPSVAALESEEASSEATDSSDEATEKNTTTPPTTAAATTFVLVDVPPYSPQLVARMKAFMGPGSKLAAILVTSRDAIHYDESPSVFTIRKSDLGLWKKAFAETEIVAYRLDIPRDCRPLVSQCLDGYGPFAWDESSKTKNATFVESGRPLTIEEWDHDVAQQIFQGNLPPDDNVDGGHEDEAEKYTPEAIRARELDKRVLAVFTPGHSYGSMTYIFPETNVCCSGFTIPVEDGRAEENPGIEGAGPALDCRGYITTSRAGISRQMQSARNLIKTYSDRFEVVLPSRGDPLYTAGDAKERQKELLDIVNEYDRIGKIYEELGIMDSGGSDDDEDEDKE
jgi:glyoxylase-like metal-dependent hydrolase (beta-lactamase superfamily II)